MIWIDSSVWLEIALDHEKADKCQKFLESTTEKIITTDFDVYSIVLIMLRYKKTPEVITTFLQVLSGLQKLSIFRPQPEIIAHALTTMNKQKLTFDDSLTYSCMNASGIKQIATLDSNFKKTDAEYIF